MSFYKKIHDNLSLQNGVLIFFNYVYLVVLGLGIAVGFLPVRILKEIDKVAWNGPVILSGILLTGFFLFFNRKTISEILVESFSAPCADAASDQPEAKKIRCIIPSRYFLCIGVLIIAAFMIFSYRLDAKDFWDDEYLILGAAKGYQETGTFHSWDFIKDTPTKEEYTRAWLHTILVAQSYNLFGVSEWSTRIVSTIFGCIFIGISFFICAYFTQNLLLSFTIAIVFLLNPDFIFYWRYARMYALLLPALSIWAYLVHKALEAPPGKKLPEQPASSLTAEYLNFNWLYAGLSLLFLYCAYHVHVNSLILALSTLIYIFILAVIGTERKYTGLLITICISGPIFYTIIPETMISSLTGFMSFFNAYNPIYLQLIAQKPFYSIISLSLMAGSIIILFNSPLKRLKKKILFCLMIVMTTIVFFVYMANFFGGHYRFICHTVPFAILLTCFVYFIVLKVFRNRNILIAGIAILLLAQTVNFIRHQKVLYYGALGQPFPSVAYQTVKNHLKPNEAVFAQGLKSYYMAGISRSTPLISLGHTKQGTTGTNPYRFDSFFSDLLKYKQGWVLWEKYKEFHVDPKVAAYVKTLFKKYHGQGIDSTGVEVFYFDESMIKIPNFK
jgi:hypothetical protein